MPTSKSTDKNLADKGLSKDQHTSPQADTAMTHGSASAQAPAKFKDKVTKPSFGAKPHKAADTLAAGSLNDESVQVSVGLQVKPQIQASFAASPDAPISAEASHASAKVVSAQNPVTAKPARPQIKGNIFEQKIFEGKKRPVVTKVKVENPEDLDLPALPLDQLIPNSTSVDNFIPRGKRGDEVALGADISDLVQNPQAVAQNQQKALQQQRQALLAQHNQLLRQRLELQAQLLELQQKAQQELEQAQQASSQAPKPQADLKAPTAPAHQATLTLEQLNLLEEKHEQAIASLSLHLEDLSAQGYIYHPSNFTLSLDETAVSKETPAPEQDPTSPFKTKFTLVNKKTKDSALTATNPADNASLTKDSTSNDKPTSLAAKENEKSLANSAANTDALDLTDAEGVHPEASELDFDFDDDDVILDFAGLDLPEAESLNVSASSDEDYTKYLYQGNTNLTALAGLDTAGYELKDLVAESTSSQLATQTSSQTTEKLAQADASGEKTATSQALSGLADSKEAGKESNKEPSKESSKESNKESNKESSKETKSAKAANQKKSGLGILDSLYALGLSQEELAERASAKSPEEIEQEIRQLEIVEALNAGKITLEQAVAAGLTEEPEEQRRFGNTFGLGAWLLSGPGKGFTPLTPRPKSAFIKKLQPRYDEFGNLIRDGHEQAVSGASQTSRDRIVLKTKELDVQLAVDEQGHLYGTTAIETISHKYKASPDLLERSSILLAADEQASNVHTGNLAVSLATEDHKSLIGDVPLSQSVVTQALNLDPKSLADKLSLSSTALLEDLRTLATQIDNENRVRNLEEKNRKYLKLLFGFGKKEEKDAPRGEFWADVDPITGLPRDSVKHAINTDVSFYDIVNRRNFFNFFAYVREDAGNSYLDTVFEIQEQPAPEPTNLQADTAQAVAAIELSHTGIAELPQPALEGTLALPDQHVSLLKDASGKAIAVSHKVSELDFKATNNKLTVHTATKPTYVGKSGVTGVPGISGTSGAVSVEEALSVAKQLESEVFYEDVIGIEIIDDDDYGFEAGLESGIRDSVNRLAAELSLRHDKTRQDKSRQERSRQERSRQDKTRQDKIQVKPRKGSIAEIAGPLVRTTTIVEKNPDLTTAQLLEQKLAEDAKLEAELAQSAAALVASGDTRFAHQDSSQSRSFRSLLTDSSRAQAALAPAEATDGIGATTSPKGLFTSGAMSTAGNASESNEGDFSHLLGSRLGASGLGAPAGVLGSLEDASQALNRQSLHSQIRDSDANHLRISKEEQEQTIEEAAKAVDTPRGAEHAFINEALTADAQRYKAAIRKKAYYRYKKLGNLFIGWSLFNWPTMINPLLSVALGTAVAMPVLNAINLNVLITLSFTVVLVQLFSNLCQEYATEPNLINRFEVSVVQQKYISHLMIFRLAVLVLIAATIVGTSLIYWAQLEVGTTLVFTGLGILVVSMLLRYSIGEMPYNYTLLGELSYLVIYGLLMVGSAFYLQTHTFETRFIIPAIACGLCVVAHLNVINMRDTYVNSNYGKNNLALVLGMKMARVFQTLLYFMALGLYSYANFVDLKPWWTYSFWIVLPLIIFHLIVMHRSRIVAAKVLNTQKHVAQVIHLLMTGLFTLTSFLHVGNFRVVLDFWNNLPPFVR